MSVAHRPTSPRAALLILLAACAGADPAGLDSGEAASSPTFDPAARSFVPLGDASLIAGSPALALYTRLDPDGATIRAPGALLTLRHAGLGRPGAIDPLGPAQPTPVDCEEADPDCVTSAAQDWPGLAALWTQEGDGPHLGWVVDAAPAGDGPLRLALQVDGGTLDTDGATVWIEEDSGLVFTFGGLAAWDATGAPLAARFITDGDTLAIDVDDALARYPITIDPTLSTASATYSGTTTGRYFGSAMAAGDVNGDGYDDVMIGAPANASANAYVEVYLGTSSGLSTSPVATLNGTVAGNFGYALSCGDLNHDGYDDLAVGAYAYSSSRGAVYIFHGSAMALPTTANTTITGPSASSRFGYVVDLHGDINGDNFADLVVSGPQYNGSQGRVYVYHGSAGGMGSLSTSVVGAVAGSQFGTAFAVGDVNGDNYDDVAIGAPAATSNTGTLTVYLGSATGLGSTAHLSATGAAAGDRFGAAVAAVDLNADGYDEIAVGAPYNGGVGAVTIYRASATGLSTSSTTTLTGTTSSESFGGALARAGDWDNTNYDDLLVGAPGYGTGAGRVYFHTGSATGVSTTASLELSSLSGAGTAFGTFIFPLGDINNNGYDDFGVGSPAVATNTGAAYVYLGRSDDADGDGYTYVTDCDDTSITVYPGAPETDYDGIDSNCDGAELCYVDADNDGYRTTTAVTSADGDCADSGEATTGDPTGDCDDTATTIHPGATELVGDGIDQTCDGSETCYVDADADGVRGVDTVVSADTDCTDTGEISSAYPSGDCNDSDAAIKPSATELTGDEIDQNCDGKETCYTDADNDTYRLTTTKASTDSDCQDSGEATASDPTGDCDDTRATVYPGATEVTGDAIDEDCDGGEVCYTDLDADGYRSSSTVVSADKDCSDAGEALSSKASGDCNDSSSAIKPSATEITGDSVDQNCDGLETCYADADGDLYRTTTTITSSDTDCTDSGEAATTVTSGDCDDTASAVNPGATELTGDSVDQNCDSKESCYVDADNDSYRLSTTLLSTDSDCADSGEALSSDPTGDCDDTAVSINPGATEIAGDGIDQTCDGQELCYGDVDADGYRTSTTSLSADTDCSDSGEALSSVTSGDCNDTSSAIKPGVSEITGDGIDQNCDSAEVCYVDADDDGYRLTSTVSSADSDCSDSGEALSSDPTGDCNDASAVAYPGATEITGDGIDGDCNGAEVCYVDADDDGYRLSTTLASADTDCADSGEALTTDPSGDCNDAAASIHPSATETLGDGIDQDCDGFENCYADADADGYRTDSTITSADGDCSDAGEATTSLPGGDCNDASAAIKPGATETIADGTDQDCDGTETCYINADGDGYRLATVTVSSDGDCADSGEALSSLPTGDCDDTKATVYPSATEITGDGIDESCDGTEVCYVNADGDAYRTSTTVTSADSDCADSGEALSTVSAGDCDDAASTINPGATEVAGDSVDQDCSGTELCYVDADNDSYRLSTTLVSTDSDCTDSGEALSADPTGDCNDAASTVNPGASETTGDAIDQNCDGAEVCYVDADSDGYRLTTTLASADTDCSDAGEALAAEPTGDCDDTNALIYPSSPEIVGDGTDSDCDGYESCYANADGDAYRTSSTTLSSDSDCLDAGEALTSTPSGDCDDTLPSVYPGASEVSGDGIDENCDGAEVCYVDADNDGYRLATTLTSSDGDCSDSGEALSTEPTGDCADAEPTINPGATEVPGDGVDQTCDTKEECYADADGDGYRTSTTITSADLDCLDAGEALATMTAGDCDDTSATIKPSAAEIPGNGVDDNCDGVELCYADADADGYRTTSTITSADGDCADAGEALSTLPAGDCDDAKNSVNPGATDAIADELDQNCDGAELCYADADSDGYRGTGTVTSTDADCRDAGEARASAPSGDCDDSNAFIAPGAAETVGDEIDQSCDGKETCYVDGDGDGYRSTSTVSSADTDCDDSGEASAATPTGDCDDSDVAYNPAALETDCTDPNDYNCDGSTGFSDDDSDGYAACEECDDTNNAVHPGATELPGDDLDSDCDGAELCYVDADDDSYRLTTTVASADTDCADSGEALSTDSTGDCDDAAADVHPGATEVVGDGLDANCDGGELCYADADADGYRTDSTRASADADCADSGEALAAAISGDCDDTNPAYHPYAPESDCADPADYNCDGSSGFSDADADGYPACEDCADDASAVFPGAPDSVGDGVDSDCNGTEVCYEDGDDDGYRTELTTTSADEDCADAGEALGSEPGDDCDDADPTSNPGGTDLPDDGIDQDCSGADSTSGGTDGGGDGGTDTSDTGPIDTNTPDDTGATDGGGGDSGATDDTATTGEGGGGDDGDTVSGPPTDAKGCGCATTQPTGALAGLGLLLVGLLRRRRG